MAGRPELFAGVGGIVADLRQDLGQLPGRIGCWEWGVGCEVEGEHHLHQCSAEELGGIAAPPNVQHPTPYSR